MKNTQSNLVLAGNRGSGTVLVRHLAISALLLVLGIVLIVLSRSLAAEVPLTAASDPEKARLLHTMSYVFIGLGIGTIILSVILPILLRLQVAKCCLDVYEDHVAGAYLLRDEGGLDIYPPFSLTYDKIRSVSCTKDRITMHTAIGKLRCQAYNAADICREISARLENTSTESNE